jgi:hypothetical protein
MAAGATKVHFSVTRPAAAAAPAGGQEVLLALEADGLDPAKAHRLVRGDDTPGGDELWTLPKPIALPRGVAVRYV